MVHKHIRNFLVENIYGDKIVKHCSKYIDLVAEKTYNNIEKFLNGQHESYKLDSINDFTLKDFLAQEIINVSPFPNYFDLGSGTSLDQVDDATDELSGELEEAFNNDQIEFLKIRREHQRLTNLINEEILSLPPSQKIPFGGINYQIAKKNFESSQQ